MTFSSHIALLKEGLVMDQKEQQLQSLSICNRIYNFIMESLAAHAFKRVILGGPLHRDGAAWTQAENDRKRSDPSATISSSSGNDKLDGKELPTVEENEEKSDVHDVDPEKRAEEEAPLPAVAIQAKPPKKVVSINDRVEEIDTSKQKMKRKKSSKKLTPLQCEDDEPKPLKSILKVGSDLSEKSGSFVNRNDD